MFRVRYRQCSWPTDFLRHYRHSEIIIPEKNAFPDGCKRADQRKRKKGNEFIIVGYFYWKRPLQENFPKDTKSTSHRYPGLEYNKRTFSI